DSTKLLSSRGILLGGFAVFKVPQEALHDFQRFFVAFLFFQLLLPMTYPRRTLVRRNTANGDMQRHSIQEPRVCTSKRILLPHTSTVVRNVMSDDEPRTAFIITKGYELLRIIGFPEQPRRNPRIPRRAGCRTS